MLPGAACLMLIVRNNLSVLDSDLWEREMKGR